MAPEVKLEKKDLPWDLRSIYDLQYFCCPECNYRIQVKQDLINHAYEDHPECVDYLNNIQDGSLCDIGKWNRGHIFKARFPSKARAEP